MNQDEQDRDLGRRVRELLEPNDVNWVQARFACSVMKTWEALQQQLRRDYEEWSQQAEQWARNSFQLTGDGRYVLIAERDGGWLRVSAGTEAITVKSADSRYSDRANITESTLKPVLNARGECRVRFREEELKIWEVSRRLLEPLLFPSNV